jgi:hypothetical protein
MVNDVSDKRNNKLLESKQPSPAEAIAACEADIERLERDRDAHQSGAGRMGQ